VRLITWNVAARVGRQAEQAAVVTAMQPDVVALQEISVRTAPRWRSALAAAGMGSCVVSLERMPASAERRRLGVLLAAREPLELLPAPPGIPWPERVVCCAIAGIEIVNVHSPISPAPDLAKVRTHEALAAYLTSSDGRRVLCGDLNTPRRELPDGDVLTFARDSAGHLRPERGERWDRAERALVHDLRRRGWVDAFRELHGYAERSASWTFAGDRGGWRLDHVLVCGLRPRAAAYAHEWRRGGLSDHSALIADLD
jgi:exodeoxyribonuclease III